MNVLEVQNSSAFFYDVNARITAKLNDNNTIILSGYASRDEFDYNKEFGFEYETVMGQATYRSIFSDRAYNNFSITFISSNLQILKGLVLNANSYITRSDKPGIMRKCIASL